MLFIPLKCIPQNDKQECRYGIYQPSLADPWSIDEQSSAVYSLPYLVSAMVCLQHQSTPSMVLPLSSLLETHCGPPRKTTWFCVHSQPSEAISFPSYLLILKNILEEVSPLRHLRTHLPSLRIAITFFFAPKVSFLHCYSHTLSHQMLRLLFPKLQDSSDQLYTHQSQIPNICLPNELNSKWFLLNCELLDNVFRSSQTNCSLKFYPNPDLFFSISYLTLYYRLISYPCYDMSSEK